MLKLKKQFLHAVTGLQQSLKTARMQIAAGEFLAWLMNTDNRSNICSSNCKPATRSSAYETEAMTEYKEGARALIVDQLENTAVPRPRTPSYATFSSAYAEAMTNIFSDAASNEEVDTDYVQSELDTAVDTFTEDYENILR